MIKLKGLSIILMLCFAISALSQSISVRAPRQVGVGENFRVAFTVNTQDVKDFRMGNVPEGLEVITGPSTSRSSSIQIINGHTSSSSSTTFTYILYAEKNGTYTISPARCVADGTNVTSQSFKIVVSGQAQNGGHGAPPMHNDNATDNREQGSHISGNDLFIRVTPNKTRVYEQEPILLTYKVYSQVNLTQLAGKMPDLNGFHVQEIPLPQQKSFAVENVNGKPYRTVTWSQYVMYPQISGKLSIPSITFNGIVVQQNRNIDPFEAFFNGGSGYIEVKKDVVAPGLNINVDALPSRPVDFSGGVGHFSIQASADHTTVKAGDPINLRVIIDGTGNLKLIKQPELKLPNDFDKYDPKTTDKSRLTQSGLTGSIIYDYLIVPRNQGNYTIPAIELTYFDLATKQYKTIKTEPIAIKVERGSGNTSIRDYSVKRDNDIHDIKRGNTKLTHTDGYFFGSTQYWMALIIPFIVFLVLLIVFRKRAADNANIVKMKGKRANKVATRRLRTANKLMMQGKDGEFYDEVLKALWGYVSDKLNISVEQLSRDNCAEKLVDGGVDNMTVTTFIDAIDECEFARFAPGDAKGKMDKVYEKAINAITDVDAMLNNKKHNSYSAKSIIITIMLLSASMVSFAEANSETNVTKEVADEAYQTGNFQKAITVYNALLKEGVSATVYYNLGNAYYRTDQIPQALLAYERAYRLEPGNKNIRFNLQFVREKTIDKIAVEEEMFIVTWYHSLINFTSADRWAYTSIIAIITALILLIVYIFAPRMWMIKSGFYGAVICLIIFIFSTLFSYLQVQQFRMHDSAIVMQHSVHLLKAPANDATPEIIIHEGTRVDILDKTIKGWYEVSLADGRQGWLKTNTVEEI